MSNKRREDAGARYPMEQRRVLLAIAAAAVVLLVGLGGAVGFALFRSGGSGPSTPRAVIVDQLALTDPNPAFVADATRKLESAGYKVDYVPSNDVTVDFYRDLPARGYAFVVLRSHTSDFQGSLDPANKAATPVASTGLFTNELYSRSTHLADQYATRLMVDGYVDRGINDKYFGITPDFILKSTRGRFQGTTIVLMGCSGLKTDDLAQAFISKGASQLVSWDQPVTAAHTDEATSELLSDLLGKKLGMSEAVASTMAKVGPDPSYGARLAVYP